MRKAAWSGSVMPAAANAVVPVPAITRMRIFSEHVSVGQHHPPVVPLRDVRLVPVLSSVSSQRGEQPDNLIMRGH